MFSSSRTMAWASNIAMCQVPAEHWRLQTYAATRYEQSGDSRSVTMSCIHTAWSRMCVPNKRPQMWMVFWMGI